MTEHEDKETEILTDDQIDDGPAAAGDAPWRERLEAAQDWQDLSMTLAEETGLDSDTILAMEGRHDDLVAAIAEATGETPADVDARLNRLTESSTQT